MTPEERHDGWQDEDAPSDEEQAELDAAATAAVENAKVLFDAMDQAREDENR